MWRGVEDPFNEWYMRAAPSSTKRKTNVDASVRQRFMVTLRSPCMRSSCVIEMQCKYKANARTIKPQLTSPGAPLPGGHRAELLVHGSAKRESNGGREDVRASLLE